MRASAGVCAAGQADGEGGSWRLGAGAVVLGVGVWYNDARCLVSVSGA
jgi:hypothetical protein